MGGWREDMDWSKSLNFVWGYFVWPYRNFSGWWKSEKLSEELGAIIGYYYEKNLTAKEGMNNKKGAREVTTVDNCVCVCLIQLVFYIKSASYVI